MKTSRIPSFYVQTMDERLTKLMEASGLSLSELKVFNPEGGLTSDQADHMIENSIGVFSLPVGIGLNFVVNGREVLVPMAIEEPSVVAGASFMAKLARDNGGFIAETTPPEMIGQIQLLDLKDLESAEETLLANKQALLDEANLVDPILNRLGGGARDLIVRKMVESPVGPFLVIHLIYDVRDAMGANAVNTACEKLAPRIEELTGGRVNLRILSNLADRRLARASCCIPAASLEFESFPGEKVRDGIIEAWAFADVDPYRAATHNKGIMNGVDAVVIATGNDWRAIEAGAHSYAARSGVYRSLSTWSRNDNGDLVGFLEMPMAVGIVGGATRVHPGAGTALKLMGIKSASELAEIIVSVGLAQNLAALRALATEGIQKGHMSLHARQVAIAAGAVGEQIEQVSARLVKEKTIRIDRAEEILIEMSKDHD
ncbi:MAG TPA: hydroxymethylglutaryl-CoA reductase, degradative [Anaerolineales bacterium]|nr:hydroxymethylglutaryl-CoA reductase, degradative [Anaerolineales bacterium]